MDTIAGFVYFYYDLNPDSIVSIGTYSPFGFPQIYIHNAVFQNIGQADILLTPTAYVDWYNSNLASIQNSKNYAYIEQDYTFFELNDTNTKVADYLLSLNAYWERYNPDYTQIYKVGSAIDPVKTYGLTSENLYMLIIPASSPTQTSQSMSQIISTAEAQQQAQITQSKSAIIQSQPQTELENAIKNATTTAQSIFNLNNPIFDIAVLLTGLIALAVILK